MVFQGGTNGYFIGVVGAIISHADARNSGAGWAAGEQCARTRDAGFLAVKRG